MRAKPERAAWIVLLSSFLTCLILTAATLVGGNWWLHNATEEETIAMTSSGIVRVRPPGGVNDVANPAQVTIGSTLSTETGAQATLNFFAPDGVTVLATVTLYGDTRVRIMQAASPRFSLSPHPHFIRLDVDVGRVRAIVTGLNTLIEVHSEPLTWTTLTQMGSNVAVEARLTQTSVTVREGEATVNARSHTAIALVKDQRAEVFPDQPITGPLSAERNLINNGNFAEPMADTWAVNLLPPKNPDELPGQVFVVTRDGRPAVQFSRSGTDWGQVEITQAINRDVRDFKSLRLQLDVYVNLQDIYNCGVFGTECPLMAKINYVDVNGNEQEWLQGFYYYLNPSVPTYCVTCAAPRVSRHELVQASQWKTFESDNLLEAFAAAGLPATTVKSITLYASGHTFESFVADVQLLGAE